MCVNFLLHKLNYVILKIVPHLCDTWFDSSFPASIALLSLDTTITQTDMEDSNIFAKHVP